MSAVRSLRELWQRDPAAIAVPALVFIASMFLYTRAIGWGLPAGDETWAADAVKPSAPLAVVWHNFGEGFNSGWFWFKYPPLHSFLLSALYAPYLAWLWASGAISSFQSDYPFGMTDPVASLSALARIGRLVSAAMGAGTVVLAYACVLRSFGRNAALGAAFATALLYPMVFYSQTTNVEVPYVFWMMLAVLAAVRLVEGRSEKVWWVLLGAGAACSVSTKELSAGAFALLPLVLVATLVARRQSASSWLIGGAIAAASFVVAGALANNVLFNPLGFSHRVGFLTQSLPREVALEYAPYYFPIELGGSRGFDVEWAQLSLAARRLLASLGWPTLVLSLAGWLVALRRRPAWALLLLAAAAGYYFVSVRAMLSLSLRYLLPIAVLFAIAAGVALAELVREGRFRAVRVGAASAAALWIFAYGWDVNRMMTGDARYQAEAWLAREAAPTSRVEIYQNRTYLPRFPAGIEVDEPAFEQRSADAFRARRPDFVVLSSSGLSGVTVRYKQDWDDDAESFEGYSPAQKSVGGQVMNFSRDANVDFLERLTPEKLGYDEAARFAVEPWIERPLIQSLNPEIVVYRSGRGAT